MSCPVGGMFCLTRFSYISSFPRGRASQSIQPQFHLATLIPHTLSPPTPPQPPLRLFFTKLRSWTILDNPSDFTAKIRLLYSAPLRMALDKLKCDREQNYFHLDTEAIVSTLVTLIHPFTPYSPRCCFWKARTSPDEPPCTVYDRHIFSFIPFWYCLVAPSLPK